MNCRIGVFGGSFDPVHIGHINSANELLSTLQLDQIYFMPCGKHAFKMGARFSGAQRLDMLQAATQDCPQLLVDSRELCKSTISSSVKSCQEIRQEFGDDAVICFIVGDDLLPSLHRWHNWKELLGLVNLVVINRQADSGLSEINNVLDKSVQHLLNNAKAEIKESRGDVLLAKLKPWPVSSTSVRQLLDIVIAADVNKQALVETGKEGGAQQANAELSRILPVGVYDYLLKSQSLNFNE